jgi:hypothetical protein
VPKETLFITFRDIPDAPQGYVIEPPPPPGAMMIKAGVFPGAFGYPDMHISHIDRDAYYKVDGKVLGRAIKIISYTNDALTPVRRDEIIAGAVRFAREAGSL